MYTVLNNINLKITENYVKIMFHMSKKRLLWNYVLKLN